MGVSANGWNSLIRSHAKSIYKTKTVRKSERFCLLRLWDCSKEEGKYKIEESEGS